MIYGWGMALPLLALGAVAARVGGVMVSRGLAGTASRAVASAGARKMIGGSEDNASAQPTYHRTGTPSNGSSAEFRAAMAGAPNIHF